MNEMRILVKIQLKERINFLNRLDKPELENK